MSNIGVIGGTFNPIHNTHLTLAYTAQKYAALSKVLFMPSGCSYLKDPRVIAAKEYRYEMTVLALQEFTAQHPEDACMEVSRMELDREGNSYTYETMEALQKQYPQDTLYLIMGADNLFSMESWYLPERIFKACHILVAVRDDKDEADVLHKAEDLKARFQARISIFPFKSSPLSSSYIRSQIEANKSIHGLVPDLVEQYIQEHLLYHDKTDCETS